MCKYLGFITRVGFRLFFSLGWIGRFAKKKEKYDPKLRYAKVHKLLAYCCKRFKTVYFIKGLENIPEDTNVVFTPNHQSNMDPLSLLAVVEKPITFISKKETENFPVVGNVIKDIDGVFIDRGNLKQEVRLMMKVTKALEENTYQSYVIFPEGTRSRDPKHTVGEFKPGSLKPAFNASKPIVPVAIYGTFRVLAKKFNMRRFPIQIEFLKPIMPEEYQKYSTIEFANKLKDIIDERVKALRAEDEILAKKYKYKTSKKELDISGL